MLRHLHPGWLSLACQSGTHTAVSFPTGGLPPSPLIYFHTFFFLPVLQYTRIIVGRSYSADVILIGTWVCLLAAAGGCSRLLSATAVGPVGLGGAQYTVIMAVAFVRSPLLLFLSRLFASAGPVCGTLGHSPCSCFRGGIWYFHLFLAGYTLWYTRGERAALLHTSPCPS
jgi:hypothetical protein